MASRSLYPNRAGDMRFVETVVKELKPLIRAVRDDRKPLEQTWLRYYNIWSAIRDQQSYAGRSKTYLATGRRLIENWVQKLKRDLFSADPWYSIDALRAQYEPRVAGMMALYQHYFVKEMQLRRHITPWLRQLVIMGTSPVVVPWRYSTRDITVLEEQFDDLTKASTGRVKEKVERLVDYAGPVWRNVDLFSWYMHPVTVSDLSQAQLIFEEQMTARDTMRRLARTPIVSGRDGYGYQYDPVAVAAAFEYGAGNVAEKFSAERQRLASKGFAGRLDLRDPNRPLDITEICWQTNFNDFLTDADNDYNPTGTCWWRITLAADHIPLRIQRLPYWSGQPPHFAAKFVEVISEFYGRGLPEVFDRMQYFLNDIADQANDALVWCMNPIAVIDGYEIQDVDSIRMRPGAKWLAKPESVKFAEPPKETPAIGFQAVQQMIALMSDTANVAPYSGVGSAGPRARGRALQTATGAQLLATESLVQIRDVVEHIEDTVLTRVMAHMHMLTQQCLVDPVLLRITGIDGAAMIEKKLTPLDVVGDFQFGWLGSTFTQNQQVRGAQMINFLQIVGSLPPEALASQNAEIDLGALLRAVWTDGMGLRHGDRIIKDKVRAVSVDPTIENELFLVDRGEEVQVAPSDPDDQHLKSHDAFLGDPRLSIQQKLALAGHIRSHVASKLAKQMLQQQRAQQEAMQQAGGMMGGPGGPGAPGANPMLPPGGGALGLPNNPGRLAQTATPADVERKTTPRGLGGPSFG